jgi:hypothetical protein
MDAAPRTIRAQYRLITVFDTSEGDSIHRRAPHGKTRAALVRLPVDVIVASSPLGVRAAQRATRTIPIVMSTLPDPDGSEA